MQFSTPFSLLRQFGHQTRVRNDDLHNFWYEMLKWELQRSLHTSWFYDVSTTLWRSSSLLNMFTKMRPCWCSWNFVCGHWISFWAGNFILYYLSLTPVFINNDNDGNKNLVKNVTLLMDLFKDLQQPFKAHTACFCNELILISWIVKFSTNRLLPLR